MHSIVNGLSANKKQFGSFLFARRSEIVAQNEVGRVLTTGFALIANRYNRGSR
jgi:hypothetical protein